MYKSLAIIESKSVAFNPKLDMEIITVKGMSEEEWEIYSSDPDRNWDMKHPFMLGEDFCGLEDYNLKLEEICKAKSHSLCRYFILD